VTDSGTTPRTADVLIIGGGIIGLSIAFHLAEQGATNVVVVEREAVGSGATSKATGGIRQQFTTPAKIRLSRESVRFYEQFEARVGRPLLFRQVGYLFRAWSLAGKGSPERLLAGWGERFAVEELTFKLYACCAFLHPALDVPMFYPRDGHQE
jgi:glycine/D-amino acid oxidase-like deaminating enzyme